MSSVVLHDGIWFPRSDTHFAALCHRKGMPVTAYQAATLRRALGKTARKGCALDIGAHVGLHTLHLAEFFDVVHAFEPSPDTRACLERNVTRLPNVTVHACALSSARGMCIMEDGEDGNTGDRRVVLGGGNVRVRTLDDVVDEFNLTPDLIKIDVQGHEFAVILGAEAILKASRPVLMVEAAAQSQVADHLRSCGYDVDAVSRKDILAVPR